MSLCQCKASDTLFTCRALWCSGFLKVIHAYFHYAWKIFIGGWLISWQRLLLKVSALAIGVQSLLIAHIHTEGWVYLRCLRAGQVVLCVSRYCMSLHDYQVLTGDKLL